MLIRCRRLAALCALTILALLATGCATDQQSYPPPTTSHSTATVPALFGGTSATSTPTSAVASTGWQTYHNTKYGYRIDLPVAYTLESDQTGGAVFSGDGVTSVPTAYGTVDGDGQIAMSAMPISQCLSASAGLPATVGSGITGYESGSWVATATPGTAPGQPGAPSGMTVLFDASGLEVNVSVVGGEGPAAYATTVRHMLATFVPGPAIANAKAC